MNLKPDPGLGVTVVAVRAVAGGTEEHVAEVAEIAYAACLADELEYEAQTRSLRATARTHDKEGNR